MSSPEMLMPSTIVLNALSPSVWWQLLNVGVPLPWDGAWSAMYTARSVGMSMQPSAVAVGLGSVASAIVGLTLAVAGMGTSLPFSRFHPFSISLPFLFPSVLSLLMEQGKVYRTNSWLYKKSHHFLSFLCVRRQVGGGRVCAGASVPCERGLLLPPLRPRVVGRAAGGEEREAGQAGGQRREGEEEGRGGPECPETRIEGRRGGV